MSRPRSLHLSLHVTETTLPRLPRARLMVDLVGMTVALPGTAAGGRGSVFMLDADFEPQARRVDLGPAQLERIVDAAAALSWPSPDVTGQWDTSDSALSMKLDVALDGERGSLTVEVMAGSFEGAEAAALRALLRTVVTELDLPVSYLHHLRAADHW